MLSALYGTAHSIQLYRADALERCKQASTDLLLVAPEDL